MGSEPQTELITTAPRTFFGAPSVALDELDAQVAFLGVPYDGGTPQPGNRTGQSTAPAIARVKSWEQLDDVGGEGFYDIEADRDRLVGVSMADVGDVAIQGSDTEANYGRMTEAVRRIVASGAMPVAFGGDHSISFPLGRGMEPAGPLDIVHVDAHSDFLDELEGSRLTGASQLRRLAELPFTRNVTALGIRNVIREEVAGMEELGVRWATTRDLLERGPAEVVRDLLPEGSAAYVSIDIDVLDSSIVPGTTLPEPGGPTYRQVRELLAEVARRNRVVGMDVVELCPPFDQSDVTARVTTWLVAHFLGEIFDQPGP